MKQQRFSNKIHSMSLGTRIIWVFLFTGICSIFILGTSFKLLTRNVEQQAFPKIVADYSYTLIREMGDPAQLDKAQKIADRTGMNIYIEREDIFIGTSKNVFDIVAFEDSYLMEMKQDGYVFQLSYRRGRAILRVIKPTESIIFMVSFRHKNGEFGLLFLGFIISIVLVIYIAYRLVRYLVAPIQSIEKGVAKFAKGNLGYRIEKKRNDDLGQLTENINQMAGKINSILEAKRQLLLAISHELRTPMTRMKIALDLPFNTKNTMRINDSLEQMEKLLSELLESEKLSADHQILDCQKVSINELVTGLIEQEYADNPSIIIQLTTDNTEAFIDSMRIRLLLRNLIGNAIKYGLDKPIKIIMKINGSQVIIRVVDEGEGISKENITHVFEPFFREDQARQRQTGGTGLGLYLVRLIVDAHAGKISITSDKGKGTTVLVMLEKEPPRR